MVTPNNIELIDIRNILGMSFFIPSYQRGYRWTKQQVEDLLDDIYEFDNKKDGKFYCLQPLVVKEEDNNWIVIDGQQRLTTIYLIQNYLENYDENEIHLKYEREEHFERLKKVKFVSCDEIKKSAQLWEDHIKKNPVDDNIEFYHLFIAKLVIHNWFNGKDDELKSKFKARLLDETKFIWYNVGEADEHELFKNLNSGKIALTNAELIKALFLNNTGNEITGKELKQNLIAEEFDQIERALREDSFWYFLAGKQNKYSSCIDLLFSLMLDTAKKEYNDFKESKDKFRTFFYFKRMILHDSEAKKTSNDEIIFDNAKRIWKDVQTYFYTLEGWNRNANTYNLIGFLRALKKPKSLSDLYSIFIDQNKSPNKTEFVRQLKQLCKEEINYKGKKYLELKYNSPNIRNLILLLNVSTLLNKPEEKVKFSFADFHKYDWDIEHISPQNPKDIDSFIKDFGIEKLPDELQDLNMLDETERKAKIEKYITTEPDNLENLTLLTSRDNRGIGNKYFFEKREQLKKYFQQGSFIPTCSMNVFVKFYTSNPSNLNFWDQEIDGQEYVSFIETSIENFFKEEVNND